MSAWRRPLQLLVLTAIGLSAALVGTGIWRALAWLCLTVPLAVGVRYLRRPPPDA